MQLKKKATKAEELADFLVRNWHCCPVSVDVSVPCCCGWGYNRHESEPEYQQCKKCVLKHSGELGR